MPVNENEQISARLAEIYQKLVSIQAMADDIMSSSNICNNHKAIFIIWYNKTLSEIKKELDEITDQVI